MINSEKPHAVFSAWGFFVIASWHVGDRERDCSYAAVNDLFWLIVDGCQLSYPCSVCHFFHRGRGLARINADYEQFSAFICAPISNN